MAAIKATCVKYISKHRVHAKVDGKTVVVQLPVNVLNRPEAGKEFDIAGRDWIDAKADPVAEADDLAERQEAAKGEPEKK